MARKSVLRIIAVSIVFTLFISMLAPYADNISKKLEMSNVSVVQAEELSGEPEGTTANPFTVVEIVPDISMATLGYMIDGAYESCGLSVFDYSTYTTAEAISSKFGSLAIADSTDSVLTYAANGATEITVDEYNNLPEDKKSGFVLSTITKTNQIGYYTEDSAGKCVIDQTDTYSPSTNGNYIPVVEYFIPTSGGNYNANFEFDKLDTTSMKYSVDSATPTSNGNYSKINFYLQDSSGTPCSFIYSPSSTARRYAIEQIVTYEAGSANKGLYVKQYKDDTMTEYYYAFNPNAIDEETYDITFVESAIGEYIYSSNYDGACSDLYKYSFVDKYTYTPGVGDYNVTFTQDSTGAYKVSDFMYAGTSGNYNAVLVKNPDGSDKYEEVMEGYGYFIKGIVASPRLAENTDIGTRYSFTIDATNYVKDGYDEYSGKWWYANQTIVVEGYKKDVCTVKSNDFFRTKVLGVATENASTYVIDYNVMAARDVEANIDKISVADYIYISDYVEDEFKGVVSTVTQFTSSNDLSWNSVMQIIETVVKNRTPLVINYSNNGYNSIAGNKTTKIRAYQMPLFCSIYGVDRFYNYFMNNFGYDNIVPAIDSSGNYKGLSYLKNEFGQYTFIPEDLETQSLLGLIIGDMTPGSSNNNFDYTKSVIENVYFNIEGNNILGTCMNNTISIGSGDKNYSEMYEALHGSESTLNITSAGIFGYLINYSNYYPNSKKNQLNILNIQPCSDFSVSSTFNLVGNYTNKFTGNGSFITTDQMYIMDEDYALDSAKSYGHEFYSSSYLSDSYFSKLYNEMYTKHKDNKYYLLKLYFRNMLPNYFGPVKLYNQISAEFIGDKEDFNTAYDVIYVGLNTGVMNTYGTTPEGFGKVLYNDSRMDGLIYVHVGDRLIGGNNMSGLLQYRVLGRKWGASYDYGTYLAESKEYYDVTGNNRYTHRTLSNADDNTSTSSIKSYLDNEQNIVLSESYRYAGNDFTTAVADKLQQYVDGGYLVVAEEPVYNADSSYIDDSSVIYNFFANNNSKVNVVNLNAVKNNVDNAKNDMKTYLGKEKININFVEKPIDYNLNSLNYNPNTLVYNMVIDDPNGSESDRYGVKLYVDADSDGLFEDVELMITKEHQMKDVEVSISKKLASTTTGIIPWKIVVYNEANSYERMEQRGYTCVRCPEKKKIHVLQISSFKEPALDMETQAYTSGAALNNLLRDVQEFEFIIDTIDVHKFVDLYVTNSGQKYTFQTSKGTEVDMLSRESMKGLYNSGININNFTKEAALKTSYYDMLIIGFGDGYSDFAYATPPSAYGDMNKTRNAVASAYANVEDFLNSGKGVLVSHDTTTYLNTDFSYKDYENMFDLTNRTFSEKYFPFSTSGKSAFGLNRLLRKYVGMDRYGITDDDDINMNGDAYDKATMPSKSISLAGYSNPNQEYIEKQGYSTYSLKKALAQGKLKDEFRSKYQSLVGIYPNYWIGYKSGNPSNSTSTLNKYGMLANKRWYMTIQYSESESNLSIIQSTNTVYKVNDGQITNYPFKIANRMKISNTHGQWYQLDMDEDVVVWYCLGDNGVAQSAGDAACGGIYGETINDVRNNYYIYTKGNITYTGAGHSPIDQIDELKLFINTIVAAYVPEKEHGTITIENSSGTVRDSSGAITDVVYTYLDSESDEEASEIISCDGTVEIAFSVENPNLTNNVTFSVTNSDGIQLSGYSYKAEGGGFMSAGVSNTITEGVTYYVRIPNSALSIADREAENSYNVVINLNIDGITTNRCVKVVRRSIFDMR